jgi:hypothetical protein
LYYNQGVLFIFIILLSEDTTNVDSAQIYQVPEIIHFGLNEKSVSGKLYALQEIDPAVYDFDINDALLSTPFISIGCGYGQLNTVAHKGRGPQYTEILLNSHLIDSPLYGYNDLSKFPIHFIECISAGKDYLGRDMINLTTKVNHYDKPYSYIKFKTGDFSTNLYNINFTRPITNDFGLYVGGLFWDSKAHLLNRQYKISSFYTNLYYDRLLPMRFDIIYSTNTHGITGTAVDSIGGESDDTFIDACFVCGKDNHRIAFYYNSDQNNYSYPFTNQLYKDDVKNYGVDLENYHNFNGLEIIYKLKGAISDIASDLCGSHSARSLDLWMQFNKSFHNLALSFSNHGALAGANVFYAPVISSGFNILNNTYIFASLSRNYRAPSISEIYEQPIAPCCSIMGNQNLLPEYYWLQELGIRRKNFALILYNNYYDDFITLQPESVNYYTYTNINSWHTMGIEGFFEAGINIHKNPVAQSITRLSVGYSNSYLFKGYSLPLIPRGNSSIFIALKRQTARFDLGLRLKEQFVACRTDINGTEMNSFRIFSVVGTARLIDIKLALSFENILNQDYEYIPNYTMPPRRFHFTIEWEFWN